MKLIDSDVKITELYAELRARGRRDAQHCMPVKDIPDLGWTKPKEKEEEPKPKKKRQEAKTDSQNNPSTKDLDLEAARNNLQQLK